MHSVDFLGRKRDLWPHVESALDSLRADHELIIAEGAGSPAEPNLQATDIVNLRVARHTNATTVIVGDIDRGGVFAHLIGTLELIPPADRHLISGFIINRFRGDDSLLTSAIEDLEQRTGIPVLGVVPWINNVRLADEDAVALERPAQANPDASGATVEIAVIHFPRIANFDDFDPLRDEPNVQLRYVASLDDFGEPTLVILPGTRATVADLDWLRSQGLDRAIQRHAEAGGHVLGICGGLQMLGNDILDPDGIEAAPGTSIEALSLLPLQTTFVADKATRRAQGKVATGLGPWAAASSSPVTGYEIHMGHSTTKAAPLFTLNGHADGAISDDGHIAGTYLHGLFHNDQLRTELLAGLGRPAPDAPQSFEAVRESEFNRLASVVSEHLDLDQLTELLWPGD